MIKTARMANSSYVKLFFPFSSQAANHDPTDVIAGMVYPPSGNNSGDGVKITQLNSANQAVTADSMPEIAATDSIILFGVIGNHDIDGFSGLKFTFGNQIAGPAKESP